MSSPSERANDTRGVPRMPQASDPPDVGSGAKWRATLHAFHLHGADTDPAGASTSSASARAWQPASLASVEASAGEIQDYPLVLSSDDAPSPPMRFSDFLDAALERVERGGQRVPILREHADALAAGVAEEVTGAAESEPLPNVLARATQALEARLGLEPPETVKLREEAARLGACLPDGARLLGLGPRAPATLLIDALRRDRRPDVAAFRDEVASLEREVTALLDADAASGADAASADELAGHLGNAGRALVDSRVLAANLAGRRGSRPLGPDRRRRLERSRAALRHYLEEAGSAPGVVCIRPGGLNEIAALPEGVRGVEHDDGIQLATDLFQGLADHVADTLRAVRIVKLELEGAYRTKKHEAALARFDWQAFRAEELRLVPVVIVFETVERLRGDRLGAFLEVQRARLPVHVVVLSTAPPDGSLVSDEPGPGALSMACRETFVLQSSLGRPVHLVQGLERMARSLRPAVAIVAIPSREDDISPLLQLAAREAGRILPLFVFDPAPDSDDGVATRFDLSGNPDPGCDWPRSERQYLDAGGAIGTRIESWTPAHAAACMPELRRHFRTIPSAAWDDAQLEIAEYLNLAGDTWLSRIPYLWAVDDEGNLLRAVMTRELAFACRDRTRSWRGLQERLERESGRRTGGTVDGQGPQTPQARETLTESGVADVRREATRDAVARVVGALLHPGGVEAALAAVSTEQPAARSAEESPTPASAGIEGVEETEGQAAALPLVSDGKPYIDSFLCTTCNDCIDINSQLFRYNADKQAEIGDPAKGTFAELVKAAEKCPARCIHPGKPRAGDKTVTEKLLARAASFD